MEERGKFKEDNRCSFPNMYERGGFSMDLQKCIENINWFCSIASDTNTSPEMLSNIMRSIKEIKECYTQLSIYLLLAINKSSPPIVLKEIVEEIANGGSEVDANILGWIAQHKNVTSEILTMIAKSRIKYFDVFATVAQNPKTPPETLQLLADRAKVGDEADGLLLSLLSGTARDATFYDLVYKKVNIRKNVAKNPNTPIEVLKYLLQDEDSDVRESAEETLQNLP